MTKLAFSFLGCERGSFHIEYGLLALLIAVTLIATLTQIEDDLGTRYNSIASAFSSNDVTGTIPPASAAGGSSPP